MNKQILDVILQSAVRTGSGVVKDIVTAQLGPTIGSLAGQVLDTLSTSLGVPPEAIPSVPQDTLDAAVTAANQDPEILRLYNEQQKATNDLLTAEMDKSNSLWTWAWRPAWMWFLMLVWFCALILFPLLRGATGADIAIPDLAEVANLTIIFLGLYMGGHTAKSIWGRK